MAELGHIVFYVRDLDRSGDFYRAVVGLESVARIFDNRAEVFSSGRSHHELLLIQVGDAPGPQAGRRIGLYHVGFKVGEDLDALRAAKARAKAFGCPIDGQSDHTVSQSLYLRDPDGNEIELFVDNPDYDWREHDDWLEAPVKPLEL